MQDQPLKALHYDRCESNRIVVVQVTDDNATVSVEGKSVGEWETVSGKKIPERMNKSRAKFQKEKLSKNMGKNHSEEPRLKGKTS